MIKCFLLLRRKAGMSREEFFRYWSVEHSKLAIETAPGMHMKRYVQNHARTHPIAETFRDSRGCSVGDFDGIAEAWWDDFDDMAKADLPAQMIEAILKDERHFVDMERSIIWFGEEKPFWPKPS
jgi:EthD domain